MADFPGRELGHNTNAIHRLGVMNPSIPDPTRRRLNQLKSAVGKCIEHQRNGYDVLASAAWDDVVRIWDEMEKDNG